MKNAVFCIAQNIDQAGTIVDRLNFVGFSNDDISVLLPDKSGTKDFALEKDTKTPEGAAIGGAAGLGLGTMLGMLAGIGSLAIPGVGPLIAAGPIMGALSGAAVGVDTGSLTGALVGLGIPEFEAKQYEGKIKGGSALISVHTESSEARSWVKEIFEHTHAKDISSTGEAGV